MNKPSMEDFVTRNEALKRPVLGRPYKGLSLPQLKAKAKIMAEQGIEVIDQSAGDIDDVGEDLAPAFKEYRRDIGKLVGIEADPKNPGLYDSPQNYQDEYPKVVELIARQGLGIEGPYEGMSTVSGRAAIAAYFMALKLQSEQMDLINGKRTKPTIIVDPMTWSGYQNSASRFGIQLAYSPMIAGNGVLQSGDGLRETIEFVKANPELRLMGVTTIQPSNPTGVALSKESIVELALICAENNINFNVDAFYSVIARNAQDIIGVKELQKLAPEVQARISFLVGETKALDSQKKTATILWLAPNGNNTVAKSTMGILRSIKGDMNIYARPDESKGAGALWSYQDGIHAAMGKRYTAVNEARSLMDEEFSPSIPFIIGDSFYGMGALVDKNGEALVRDKDNRPVSDPNIAAEILLNKHGLMVATGSMFRPEGANLLARFTAASTKDKIKNGGDILRKLSEQANG